MQPTIGTNSLKVAKASVENQMREVELHDLMNVLISKEVTIYVLMFDYNWGLISAFINGRALAWKKR